MQFELMTPMEQAALIAAVSLSVFAATYALDRAIRWLLTLRDRRVPERRGNGQGFQSRRVRRGRTASVQKDGGDPACATRLSESRRGV